MVGPLKGNMPKFYMKPVTEFGDAVGGQEGKLVEMATGTLIFSDKGNLQQEIEGANAFNFNKGAAPGQKIKFD